jgi:DNA polymerase III subunit delta'
MPFSGIRGHQRSISVLNRILGSERIAHAYLFSGPQGVGKELTALSFIKALFCQNGSACGECPSCRKLESGNHPDFHRVEPDGQFIKIDQIRALQKELGYRPYEASRKACIIDSAEKFNLSSGNALLKTLEEPPGKAIIILLTSARESVLATIRSRCQELLFSVVPENEIAALLVSRGVDEETARISASLADGSVGKALALCAEGSGQDRAEIITRACGLSLQDMASLFALSELFDKDREKAIYALDLLLGFWRDMLHIRSGFNDPVNRDMRDLLAGEAGKRSSRSIMEGIETILQTRQAIQRNANVRLAMDVLNMKLAV